MVIIKNKKGLFFLVELILLIIVLIVVILSFPRSQDGFLANKGPLDLERLGFTTLYSLDTAGVLENFTNRSNFMQSNFSALSIYIREAFPSTVALNLEYFNGTNCFSESGLLLSSCGNVTKAKDTAVVHYIFAKVEKPITIVLYMRGIMA